MAFKYTVELLYDVTLGNRRERHQYSRTI